ncbi:unnamed protein product [Plutella xylostella]|uniref:(diamondback moth) hypothetical protein n=1 Tax=Plutella xylostella TaxID=51655 RepID=A0A8S4GBL3_PLUXY|nr:unnamed protein product [Plutella xylostella]
MFYIKPLILFVAIEFTCAFYVRDGSDGSKNAIFESRSPRFSDGILTKKLLRKNKQVYRRESDKAKTDGKGDSQLPYCTDMEKGRWGSGQHMLTRVCNSGLTSEMQQPILEPRGHAQSAPYDDTACNTWRGI